MIPTITFGDIVTVAVISLIAGWSIGMYSYYRLQKKFKG